MTQVETPVHQDDSDQRPYRPHGGMIKVWGCRDEEILCDGPAGTGKTRGILEKVYQFCCKWPDARVLFTRHTRKSLTDSVLVTWEEKVVPRNHPMLEGAGRAHRHEYVFPNGSTIVVFGMDKGGKEKIMSTEFDMIVCFEATEITENQYETLTTRLRNHKAPYQQIIAECNPGPPTHWLKRRADDGISTRFPSRHEDNPTVTPEYIEKLDRLSGHRYQRLRKGIWAAAEGVVYPDWDFTVHVVEQPWAGEHPPEGWKIVRSIDFGFTNPFVCQWWALDPDKRMFLYREIYMSNRLVEDHARQIVQLSHEERISTTVADHDAEDRSTLWKYGVPTAPARKFIEPGLKAVAARLRPAGDGRPRLFVCADCLVETDTRMVDDKHPICSIQEFDAYSWPEPVEGKVKKEEPLDLYNHGMDALRYAVVFIDDIQIDESGAGAVESEHDRYHRLYGDPAPASSRDAGPVTVIQTGARSLYDRI